MIVIIASTFFAFIRDFPAFELATLILVVARPFAVVTCRPGLLRIQLCGLLLHRISLLSYRSNLTPFRDVTQSVHRCRSLNAADLLIFQGVEAFWHE